MTNKIKAYEKSFDYSYTLSAYATIELKKPAQKLPRWCKFKHRTKIMVDLRSYVGRKKSAMYTQIKRLVLLTKREIAMFSDFFVNIIARWFSTSRI
jgi:hypothetical protein